MSPRVTTSANTRILILQPVAVTVIGRDAGIPVIHLLRPALARAARRGTVRTDVVKIAIDVHAGLDVNVLFPVVGTAAAGILCASGMPSPIPRVEEGVRRLAVAVTRLRGLRGTPRQAVAAEGTFPHAVSRLAQSLLGRPR